MNKIVLCAASLAALFATPVYAADLGVIDQAAPVGFAAPARDWTGFYAGVFGGVTSGPFEWDFITPGLGAPILEQDLNGGGLLAGFQIGADYQFDQFVVGAVADLAITNHRLDVTTAAGGLVANQTSTLAYLGTVRARAGFAFDNILAYVHGGLAYGQTDVEFTGPVGGTVNNPNRLGYTVGAGVEYAITDNVSLQTEYSYTHFGDEQIFDAGAPLGVVNETLSFHTVKAGVNFRF